MNNKRIDAGLIQGHERESGQPDILVFNGSQAELDIRNLNERLDDAAEQLEAAASGGVVRDYVGVALVRLEMRDLDVRGLNRIIRELEQ